MTNVHKRHSLFKEDSQRQGCGESSFQFSSNRPEAIAQRMLQEMANQSPQVRQLMAFQKLVCIDSPVLQRVTSGNTSHFNNDSHQSAKDEAYRRKVCKPGKLATRFRKAGITSKHKMILSMNSTTPGKTKFILVVAVTLGEDSGDDHVSYITAYHSLVKAARGEPDSTYIDI